MNKLAEKLFKDRKRTVIYLTAVVLSAILLFVGNRVAYDRETMFLGGYEDGACGATVSEIISEYYENFQEDGDELIADTVMVFRCKIRNGELRGKSVIGYQLISITDASPLDRVKEGDRILIARVTDDSVKYDWYMHDFDRSLPLIILGGAFALLVIVFGRKKGINTLISLAFTCVAVFAVFVPSILSGHNIYLWSVMTCVYIIVMTLLITDDSDKKTLAAIIGCTSGVVFSGILTVITAHFLELTGITSEETIYIMQNFEIDLHALIFAGIILGSVGAVMDVSVSISSSLKEIYEQVDEPTFAGLVRSGITIGRDIMGTMANTLVLAYIGCELSATLLAVVYSSSLTTLFSREKIVEELLQALVGSMGILMTIPLTAVVSSALYVKTGKRKK